MKIDLAVQQNLNSLKFIDHYTGFVAGDNGLILKQIRAGEVGMIFQLHQITITKMYHSQMSLME